MSLDFLFATPSDFQSHLDAGLMPKEIAALYGVSEETLLRLDFFKTTKLRKAFCARPAVSFGEPVSIIELSPFMCAVVIDGEFDLPHYCGAPSVHRFRFCVGHRSTHIERDRNV